jgi:hypothetical protein
MTGVMALCSTGALVILLMAGRKKNGEARYAY